MEAKIQNKIIYSAFVLTIKARPTTLGELTHIWDEGKTWLKIKVIKELGHRSVVDHVFKMYKALNLATFTLLEFMWLILLLYTCHLMSYEQNFYYGVFSLMMVSVCCYLCHVSYPFYLELSIDKWFCPDKLLSEETKWVLGRPKEYFLDAIS